MRAGRDSRITVASSTTATVLIADYLFKATAAQHFGTRQLGSFFAMFYAAQNAIAAIDGERVPAGDYTVVFGKQPPGTS